MENSDRSRVRKYRKSSVPRLRWTPELHDHFVEAVQKLGGKYKATPKRIMQMMAVRGLKISHIKSHLQMYRITKESINPNGLIASTKNYQEKRAPDYIALLSLGQVLQGVREPPAHSHRKQVKGPFTCKARSKITQKAENLFSHEFQGKKGITTSAITKRDVDIPWANFELPEANAPNFWGLGSHQTSHESSTHIGPINLDLTMCSSS